MATFRHRGKYWESAFAERVFSPPRGFGMLKRERGTGIWRAWLRVPPYLVSDMLSLSSQSRPLYVLLHEFKSGRDRWIKRFSLQPPLRKN